MSTSGAAEFRGRVVRSAAWYGATRLWGQFISWAVTLLLARMLAPREYGLFAMALSVLSLIELIQEFGLGTALIQRRDLTRRQVNGVFWVIASTSVVLTLVTGSAAGSISRLYGEPALTWPLRLLCLTFLLNSLGTVPYSLLTKDINLRQRSLAEAFGVSASALVALTLARLGYGIEALVVGHLARAVVLNSCLGAFAGWVPGRSVDFSGIRELLTFGVRIAGIHLVSTASTAANTWILARLLSSTALGLFAMAQSLTEAPYRLSSAIINQVSLPIFSKLQDDRTLLAAYFLKISKYLVVVSLPLQLGLAVIAPDLVPILLSSKWEALTGPFQVLCLESVFVLATLTCTPLLMARGRASFLLNVSIVWFVGLTAATMATAAFGLGAVVVARLFVIGPLRLVLLVATLRELEVSLGLYLRRLAAPLLAVGIMVGVVEIMRHAVGLAGGGAESLVVVVASGALAYGSALFLLDRTLGSEIRTVARDLLSVSHA